MTALLGVAPTETLDPTFLWDFSGYETKKPLVSHRYALIYGNPDEETSNTITEIARETGIKTISVNKRLPWCDLSFPNASPEQWLWLFSHADWIVTQFYHGLIFSIKNEKPFILLRHNGKKAKLEGLASNLGFLERIMNQPVSKAVAVHSLQTFDYTKITEELKKRKKTSEEFIRNALAY